MTTRRRTTNTRSTKTSIAARLPRATGATPSSLHSPALVPADGPSASNLGLGTEADVTGRATPNVTKRLSLAEVSTLVSILVAALYLLGLAVVERQLESGGRLDPATAWHTAPLVPKPTVALQAVHMFFAPAALTATGTTLIGTIVIWVAIARVARTRLGRALRRLVYRAANRVFGTRPRLVLWLTGAGLLILIAIVAAVIVASIGLAVTGVSPIYRGEPGPIRLGSLALSYLSGVVMALPLYAKWGLFQSPTTQWIWTSFTRRRWLWSMTFAYVANLFSAYYTASVARDLLPPITITMTSRATITGALIAHTDGYWFVLTESKIRGQVKPVRDGEVSTIALGASIP